MGTLLTDISECLWSMNIIRDSLPSTHKLTTFWTSSSVMENELYSCQWIELINEYFEYFRDPKKVNLYYLPTVSYVFIWSDDKNWEVRADLPTSEAPSKATRNCFITLTSSGLATSPPSFLLNFRCEFFLEFTREGLRDDALEHCPDASSLVLVLVCALQFEGIELLRLWTTL